MTTRPTVIAVLVMCAAAFVIAAPAYAAVIRWTPDKVEAELKANSPLAGGGEVGNAVLRADCQGLGKGLRGKYARFQCKVRYRGSNGSYQVNLRLRVQQIGGRLCVSALQLVPGGTLPPWRFPPDEIIGRYIRPEKVCTA